MKSFKEEMRHHLEVRGKGFTLIEVIVVLVIIAILLAIAVPNVLAYINRAKEIEAEAKARNIYLGATAELALTLGKIEGGSVGGYNIGDMELVSYLSSGEHEEHIAEMAGISVDDFDATYLQTVPYAANADVSVGKAMIYVNSGVVAYVVYQYDDDTYAIYNGVTGDISLTQDSVLYDFAYNTP